MRYRDQGSLHSVTVSREEVNAFARRWPASGLPNRAIWFQFDKRTGDLVDISPENLDGDAVVALSQDAQAYAEQQAKTHRKNPIAIYNPPRRGVRSSTQHADPFTHHQIRVAEKTLRMPDAILGVLGGMTKAEARAILRKHGRAVEENPIMKQLRSQVRSNPHRKNPGSAYHERHARLYNRLAESTTATIPTHRTARAKQLAREVASSYAGSATAHWESMADARALGMNPPKQLIYGCVLEIRAQKTRHPDYKGQRFQHRFSKASQVECYGLTDGSLLIRSKRGARLWAPEGEAHG